MFETRKIVIRKLVKWLLFFLLGVIVSIGVLYVYLASVTGETAAQRAIFERKNYVS